MEIDIHSGYRFAFSDHNASTSTTTRGLTECLIHCHGTVHSIASDQETSFHSKEAQQWDSLHEIKLSYQISHHLEVAVLNEG